MTELKPIPATASEESVVQIQAENSSFYTVGYSFATPQPTDQFGNKSFVENNVPTNEDDWGALNQDIAFTCRGDTPVRTPPLITTRSPSTSILSYTYPMFVSEPHFHVEERPASQSSEYEKIFLGNLLFEMSADVIVWMIEVATGIKIPKSRVIVHVKSSKHSSTRQAGASHTGTGCVNLLATADELAGLLPFNQRIFCGADSVFVSATQESLCVFLRDRKVSPGRKEPRHPVVIELARHPEARSAGSHTAASPLTVMPVRYFRYEVAAPPPYGLPRPANPVVLFVGGICYEATPGFVAWMLSLGGVPVREENVSLFRDPKSGRASGCALVTVEDYQVQSLLSLSRCLHCDPSGVFFGDPESLRAHVHHMRSHGDFARGPSHPVVIELKRSSGATLEEPPSYEQSLLRMTPPVPTYKQLS